MSIDADHQITIQKFLNSVAEYRSTQQFSFWEQREKAFKANSASFRLICRLLSVAEKHNFEKRARTLKSVHPLSLQVHLETGVANGVLVVRTVTDCVELLSKLVTNNLEFEFRISAEENCTQLVEKISNSPFRVVTDYEKLSNSFWNFYLPSEQRN